MIRQILLPLIIAISLAGWGQDCSTTQCIALDSQVKGNLGVTHLNGGINASGGTFWRGDGQWGTPLGNITGGSCGANSFFTSINNLGVPTCGTPSAAPSPRTVIHFNEEFCDGFASTGIASYPNPGITGTMLPGAVGSLNWQIENEGSDNNNAVVAMGNDGDNHPCVVQLQTGTSSLNLVDAGTQVYFASGSSHRTKGFYRLDNHVWSMHGGFSSTSTQNQIVYFGWMDTPQIGSVGLTAGAIFFQATSTATNGHWMCLAYSGNGGPSTSVDSGVALQQNVYHDFQIDSNGTGTITYSIDGTGVCSISTNVPTFQPAEGFAPVFGIDATDRAASKTMNVDYFDLVYALSR